MRRIKEHLGGWNLFQRAVTLLLTACVILLAAYAALVWFYLSAMSRDMAVLTSNQAETGRAFLAIKEQQAASNMRLDAMRGELNSNLNAIREELQALNEKASKAAEVTPPPNG
jgi:Tfp pilus assembly protein PilO